VVESKNITSFRDSWKARHEGKNTLVFNFINSKKDVSHIENDGLDFSKRKKKTK
ncbi:Bifocal, partial [Caligus rogercresseyi]